MGSIGPNSNHAKLNLNTGAKQAAENIQKPIGKPIGESVAGPMKMPEGVKEMAAEAVEHMSQMADDVVEGVKSIWSPKQAEAAQKKMNLFETKIDPKAIVEDIRTAEGGEKTKLLLGFQGQLDDMSQKQLDSTLEYIVGEMADDKNIDDPLLGALAKSVMDETASRKPKFIRIGGDHPWDKPFPKPPVNPKTLDKLEPKVLDRLNVLMD